MPADLVAPARKEFTDKDRQRLAEYLVNFPSSDRTKKRIFEQAGAKLPGHTATSWHEHYRKTGREDVERKIAKIVRERERQRQARRDAMSPAAESASDVDQLDSEPEGRTQYRPVASTSKARLVAAPPADTPRASASGSGSRRTLYLSDDDDDEPVDRRMESGKERYERKSRAKFTDDDFDLCVKVMVQQEKQGLTNRERDIALAERCPDHTVYSWQSWISNNRRELDEAVRDYRKHRAERKLAKKDKRSRDAGEREGGVASMPRNTVREPITTAYSPKTRRMNEDPRQRQVVAQAPYSNLAFDSRPDAMRHEQLLLGKQLNVQREARDNAMRRRELMTRPLEDDDFDDDLRPRRRPLDKGKGRAVSPEQSSSDTPGWTIRRASESAHEEADNASAIETVDALADRFSDFTDEDKHELVHQYARNLVKKHDPDTCFVYLGLKRPQHTEERWRAYFHYKLAEILGLVARKVQQIEKSQAAKAKRLSAATAATEEEEDAESAAAAARRDEARRQAELEADERVARENEERFRREEERQDREKAERAREAGAQRGEEVQRQQARTSARGLTAARSERPAASGEVIVDSDGFDAASPSPEPARFGPAEVSDRVLVEATPDKSSEAAATQSGLVRTPRHTPPTRPSQEEDEEDSLGPAGAVEEALPRAVESEGEGSSPESAVPRHSQYSVMPSPFIQSGPLAYSNNANGAGDVVIEVVDVKNETDDDHDLIITPAVEASRVRIEQDQPDGLSDDDGEFWNALSPAENAHIHNLHSLVAVVQQQHDARAAEPSIGQTRAAEPKKTELPDGRPVREGSGGQVNTASSPIPSKAKGSAAVVEPTNQPQGEVAVAVVSSKAPAQAIANPNASPSRKRRREASSPPVQTAHAHREDEAPAAKRQKVDAPASVSDQQHPTTGRATLEPARQARKSAPSALPARALGTPIPTPSRRVPRASLAAMSRQTTGSPAPERAGSAAPQNSGTAAKVAEPIPSARPLAASAAAACPAATAAGPPTQPMTTAKVPRSRSLADEIGDLARRYGVHRESIKHIMFCICAKGDMVNLAHLVKWFSPAHRPAEGTAEYEELRKLAQDQVWTLREDTIVLEGSDSALEQLARKRGSAAIAKRRQFLQRAKITSVGLLRKDLYVLS